MRAALLPAPVLLGGAVLAAGALWALVRPGGSPAAPAEPAPMLAGMAAAAPTAAPPAAAAQRGPPGPQHLWSVGGPERDSLLGYGLARLGDLNGDGADDVAASLRQGGQGEVWLLSGRDGSLLRRLLVGVPNALPVAGAGDLNGDGTPDVLVYYMAGQFVRALSGADGRVLFSAASSGSPYPVHFGWAMATMDDMEGDGWREVVISSPYSEHTGGSSMRRGDIQIYSGRTGRLLRTIRPPEEDNHLGWALAVASDLDGDGANDLVVGAPNTCRTPLNPAPPLCGPWDLAAGKVSAFSGATGRRLWAVRGLDGEDQFGYSVAVLPDIDGDGVPDVVASALPHNMSFVRPPRPGYAMVLSGATGRVLAVVRGDPGMSFGRAVASVGDVDGDGFADFAALTSGQIHVFSGRDFSRIQVVENDHLAPGFGAKLVGMGRTNDDDVPDLVADQVMWGNDNNTRGAVLMFSLAPEGITAFGPSCPGPDPSPPRIATRGRAVDGQALRVHVHEAPPGRTALLMVGASDRAFGGIPLPLDLGGIGLPGCSLLAAPHLILTAPVDPRGSAAFRLDLLADPSGAPNLFYLQGAVLDPGAPGAPPSLTRALRVTTL